MNFLRKYHNRYSISIELVSALNDSTFLISPPDGFTDGTVRAEYSGVYFTLSSVDLSQKSKITKSGTVYNFSLEFNFPNFSRSDQFQQAFSKLAEIRLTLNTGAVIRINKHDISLNSPIDVEFQSNLKTVGFSAQIEQIFPLMIDE
ncbi:MAG: hypothetical protein ACOH1X_02800 [Kaistella sp.]